MKNLVKYLFFPNKEKQKILSGPSKGMYVKYDINNRFQHLLGLYEREIYSWLIKGMKRSDILIDIGANDGYYVLAFLKTGKKVIACEPATVVEQLKQNAQLNGYHESSGFKVERKLIGNQDIGGLPVIELIRPYNGNYFFLVDIDGGEYELLNSCGINFPYTSARWLIETHSAELEKNCIDFLHMHNYKVHIIRNGWWRKLIPEQRPLPHNRWLYAEPI
jgi:hypothetical protein